MGREPYILLAGLGLLAGGFVGVLSMKLLSPRPPLGAGVDIHDVVASATPAEIVEPPALTRPIEQPAAAQPVAQAASVEPSSLEPADRYAIVDNSFSNAEPVAALEPDAAAEAEVAFAAAAPPRDPFAGGSRFGGAATMVEEPREEEPQLLDPTAAEDARPLPPADMSGPPRQPDLLPPPATVAADLDEPHDTRAAAAAYVPAAAGQAPRHEVTRYVAAVGDSWWSLAERMYGDGRYYRALFAWNRAVNPRVSLVPGTPLELPPLSKLAVAWPALVPDEEPRRDLGAGG